MDHTDIPSFTIRGGASELEAAAVAVVIQQVLEVEAAVRSEPPKRSRQSAWVRSARHSPMVGPTTPNTRFVRWSVEP